MSAADQRGRVVFNGVPVPGATVTATQGQTVRTAVTEADGSYSLPELADGEWRFAIAMRGFAPVSETIVIGRETGQREWPLTLLAFDAINAAPAAAVSVDRPATTSGAAPASGSSGVRPPQAPARPAAGNTPAAAAAAPESPGGDAAAADGLLINGSVNNGAASPFAQLAAFGNNRRGGRSLYNGGLGIVFGNSALDARPFSFTNDRAPKPSYDDLQVLGTFSGPLKGPWSARHRPTLFFGYQRTVEHNATTGSSRVPTAAERAGDFSQSLDAFGQPVAIVDPLTGRPFANNRIPADRISPQAAVLLGYYPSANAAGGGFNYQTPLVANVHQQNVQFRISEALTGRDQLFGNALYTRTATKSNSLFSFVDDTAVSAGDYAVNWMHRFSQFMSLRLRYQAQTQATKTTPFFAGVTNVSGNAGIVGNDQVEANWGPPSLQFSSGLAALGDAAFADNNSRTDTGSAEMIRSVGRHNLTFGGGLGRQAFDVNAQENARGGFGFTGARSGYDVADFLLGLPSTSAIAFGNADKTFNGRTSNLYITDDWRANSSLTVNMGVRWEYESPLTEAKNRLSNLDVDPGFTAARTVTAEQGREGRALLNSDWSGVQPRVGVAWRPVAGSSLVVRGGYGVYRNTNVYETLARLLSQQPPFSTTFSVASSSAAPLSLAQGFSPSGVASSNTFAIDPDFRVGFAHNWQVSAQRDLPASLTIIGTYFGTRGRHLLQEFLPNSFAPGAINPCVSCPSGFTYLTSNGDSSRHAGQVQVRRRLRNGFTATVQYTLAKATDNASAFVPSGVGSASSGIAGATIAQDWTNLDAEQSRSAFDQRHQLSVQMEYTSGMGVAGGALLDGMRGKLLKGWTLTSRITAGSGLPLTPIVLIPSGGTGVAGTIRASLTGVTTDAPDGYYLNPAAYALPSAGEWGTAGRNSISGPAQFSMNAGLGRSFVMSERVTLDWRIDANNILNTVTYSSVNTLLGSPQFGLPNRANTMRKLQTTARLRF